MIEVEFEELKKIELELLIKIDRICCEQGLRYWLTAGTLLGAIRHKGFIPWDDDVDIAMPRKDYMLFIDYCKKNKVCFNLLSHEVNDAYFRLFAKACDNNTIIEDNEAYTKNCETGVWIDIFPLDGLGNDYKKAKNIFRTTKFKRSLLIASIWKRYFRSKSRSIVYEPIRLFFYLGSRFVNKKKLIDDIERKYVDFDFDSSNYCGCVCGSYGVMDKEWFDETIDVEFEGRKFKTIKEYDRLLKYFYGDYTSLPPVEQRTTHHDFKAFWKDRL